MMLSLELISSQPHSITSVILRSKTMSLASGDNSLLHPEIFFYSSLMALDLGGFFLAFADLLL